MPHNEIIPISSNINNTFDNTINTVNIINTTSNPINTIDKNINTITSNNIGIYHHYHQIPNPNQT